MTGPGGAPFGEFAGGDFAAEAEADRAAASVFVRAIDLPTASLREARAAVRIQLDILSPLPLAETAWSLIGVGPAEGGRTRYAVGIIPVSLFDEEGGQASVIELPGWLYGRSLMFRFEHPRLTDEKAQARLRWMRRAAVSGLCLAMLLGAVTVRLGDEIGRAEARSDATDLVVRKIAQQNRLRSGGQDGWSQVSGSRQARLTACAFGVLAAGSTGPVQLTDLSVANGTVKAGFSQPLTLAQIDAFRTRGVDPAEEPGGTASLPRRVQMTAGACK